MATWEVVEYAGQTLVRLLEKQFAILLPNNNISIQVASASHFEQYATAQQPSITLFLYQILENPEMRNAAARKLADGRSVRQPLPLELCYIITPWSVRVQDSIGVDAKATEEEHRLLGGILQTFYEHAEVTRSELTEGMNAVWSRIDTMQILLESPASEDLFRIWDSTEHAYRTSLTYRVRVLGLEPIQALDGSPVIDANFTAGELR